MTEQQADRPPPASPPRRVSGRRKALRVLVVVLGVVLVLVAALYLNRREAARDLLVGWLDRRGVRSEVEVERIDLQGFVARVRIGDPADPDVTVERVEVDYAVGLPWSAAGAGVTPTRIRLVRPIVHARWIDGRFSLGELDPLIEEFSDRPPRPDARGPVVLIERGRLRLTTEYGPVQALGDARIDDGKLMRLTARMPTAALRSGAFAARIEAAALQVTTVGDRAVVGFNARLRGLQTQRSRLEDATLTLGAAVPYPDVADRRNDGQVWLNADLTAARGRSGEASLTGLEADLAFRGMSRGWIDALSLSGRSDVAVSTASLTTSAVALRQARYRVDDADTRLTRDARDIRWRLAGPGGLDAGGLTLAGMDMTGVRTRSARLTAGGRNGAFEVSGPLDLTADRFVFDALTLRDVRGQLDADVTSAELLAIRLDGALSARDGAWPLFGPPGDDDVAELVEMKRALASFALDAPAVGIAAGSSGTVVTLRRPATIRPANGGVLTLAPAAGPVFAAPPGQAGGGALNLTATRGRGLPTLDVAVPAWRLTESGFQAEIAGSAGLDFAFARGAAIETRGLLTSGGGRLTYGARDCAAITVDMFELGENDALDLSGALCPTPGAPLVSVADGAWRVRGRLDGVAATVPFLAVRATDGAGPLAVNGGPAGVDLEVGIDRATVTDTTTPARFNPLAASGRVALAAEDWSGDIDLAVQGRRLGSIAIAHDGQSGAGGVAFDARGVTFAPDGLQPAMVTPLLDALVRSPVEGQVDFTGRFDWTQDAAPTSFGQLSIPGLNFDSPAGRVTGLRGEVEFDSLTPLVTAPDQRLTIDRIDAFAPLTDLEIDFGLAADSVTVSGADVAVGGGFIRIEPFALPLTPDTPWSGVLVLDRVQLGDLVAGSGFRDKVMLDAVVSGRLPFTVNAEGEVALAAGHLEAVQPGRLSIRREALTGVQAEGAGEEVPPNLVQDLAYQAMENLSFDVLTAEVNSADGGRLEVLFHIVGEHRPPVRQDLRLSLQELISRDFLNRESLPLPSGTDIDLTLDTSINLEQLLADWIDLQRARAGEPPLPAPPAS